MRNANAKVSDPKKFITCSGDRFHIEYKGEVQKDGTVKLVESGKTDIRQAINAYKDQTDLDYIRKKIEQGDLSVLNPAKPQYGDFTNMPSTYAEALQMQIDANDYFYSLDPEVRNKFDNDVNQFLASAGSEVWMKKLGLTPVVPETTADPVKVSEVETKDVP